MSSRKVHSPQQWQLCSRRTGTPSQGCGRHDQLQKADGVVSPDMRNKRVGNAGPKEIDLEAVKEKLADVPLKNRTTHRAVAAWVGLTQSTLHCDT